MSALERYFQLKNEGKTDREIVSLMQEEGFQMNEINDAINQAAIKSAINQYPEENYVEQTPLQEQPIEDFQTTVDSYNPYYSYQTTSLDTTTEIIEQIVNKKLKEILDILSNLKRESTYTQKELENLKERLRKIEEGFDFVQRAIIGKIGEFEDNARTIQKDLENIHGTMSKLMNPLIDTYNELRDYKDQNKTKSIEKQEK